MSPVVDIIKQSYKNTKKEILKIIKLVELEKDRKEEEEKDKKTEDIEIMDKIHGRIL